MFTQTPTLPLQRGRALAWSVREGVNKEKYIFDQMFFYMNNAIYI